MKKITLSIGLLAGILTSNAQDTINVFVDKNNVYYFKHNSIEVIKKYPHLNKDIIVYIEEDERLQIHLYDNKLRTRKFTTTFEDGDITENIFDSKDNIYYSPVGPLKLNVGKAKLIQKL